MPHIHNEGQHRGRSAITLTAASALFIDPYLPSHCLWVNMLREDGIHLEWCTTGDTESQVPEVGQSNEGLLVTKDTSCVVLL